MDVDVVPVKYDSEFKSFLILTVPTINSFVIDLQYPDLSYHTPSRKL